MNNHKQDVEDMGDWSQEDMDLWWQQAQQRHGVDCSIETPTATNNHMQCCWQHNPDDPIVEELDD